MSRILMIVVLIALVYWLLKSYRRGENRTDAPPKSEDMVRCEHCGIHLPRGESVQDNNDFFCCEEHRRLHTNNL